MIPRAVVETPTDKDNPAEEAEEEEEAGEEAVEAVAVGTEDVAHPEPKVNVIN